MLTARTVVQSIARILQSLRTFMLNSVNLCLCRQVRKLVMVGRNGRFVSLGDLLYVFNCRPCLPNLY